MNVRLSILIRIWAQFMQRAHTLGSFLVSLKFRISDRCQREKLQQNWSTPWSTYQDASVFSKRHLKGKYFLCIIALLKIIFNNSD